MRQGKTQSDGAREGEDVTGAREEPAAPGQPITHSTSRTAQIEEALRLYCQGMTVAATARAMGQAETSVRRWIRLGLATLAGDTRAERRLELQRLIESQRAVARAAWESYYEERTRLVPTAETAESVENGTPSDDTDQTGGDGNSGTNGNGLWLPLPASGADARASERGEKSGESRTERLRPGGRGLGGEVQNQQRGKNGKNGNPGDSPLPQSGGGAGGGGRGKHGKHTPRADNIPPPRVPQGARYLALALAAQREVARLQGLYEKLAEEPAPMSLTIIRRPDGPENKPPTTAEASPDIPADGEDADGR